MNAIRSKAEPARPAPNEPAPSILPEALLTAAAAVRYSAEEERRGELSACTSACPVVHTQSRARAFDSSQWLESFKSVEFTNEDSLTQSVFQCCQVRGFPAQLGYLNCYRVVFHVRGLRRPQKVRWPRELNALQLQKTHTNRKSTSKSRKHLMLITKTNKETHCKCSQHNQIKNFICSAFLYLVVLWAFAARVVKLMKLFS